MNDNKEITYQPDYEKLTQEANEHFTDILSSAKTNMGIAKSIVDYMVIQMKVLEANLRESLITTDEESIKKLSVEQKLSYLHHVLYENNSPTAITMFFESLFSLKDSNGISEISRLDATRFVTAVNKKGFPIIRPRNPLTYLATKIGIYDNDSTHENRWYKGKECLIGDLNENDNKDDEDNTDTSDNTDISYEDMVQGLEWDDDRLSNYIYLPDDLRTIYNYIRQNYTHKEMREEFFKKYKVELSESKLRTRIKRMGELLKKPQKPDKRKKKCCVCGKEKLIAEFTHDKSKKDGYSSRCKQCDRERKRKK